MSSHSHQPVHVSPGSWFTACAIDDALRELEDESLGGGSRTSRWGESLGRVAGGRLGGRWACVTACAAFLGDLELVRLARDCGHEWDAYTCAFAAYSGNLECLKYAHEHGCPWNKSTCDKAAGYGHLECLKYAHEHGCPWDENTCYNAAKNGHLECLKYACAHGCPGSAPYVKALKEVVLPDADERFVVEVALVFHRSGEISMREFLPLWAEHRMFYRKAHYEAVRKFHASLRLNR